MISPLIIKDVNLSEAWYNTIKHIVDNPGKEVSPLLISLTDFQETLHVRNGLDNHLVRAKLGSIQTVSETIFPQSLYEFCHKDRFTLYDTYLHENLPRLKKIDTSNANGTYFERLISYDTGSKKVNQLEIIIKSMQEKNIRRRSKLQASIFDPSKDHTNRPFQGFPCLQHVTFFESEGKLVLNSFYAIQYIFRRAYGNWLGLINLGKFIATELDLEFERFNCFVGVEQLEDKLTKSQAKKLIESICQK